MVLKKEQNVYHCFNIFNIQIHIYSVLVKVLLTYFVGL